VLPNAAVLFVRPAHCTSSSTSRPRVCSSRARASCRFTRSTLHKHGPDRCNPGTTTSADSRPLPFLCPPRPQTVLPSSNKTPPTRCPRQKSPADASKINRHNFRPTHLGQVRAFNPHRASLKAYCKSPYRERPGPNTLFRLRSSLRRGAHDTALRISHQLSGTDSALTLVPAGNERLCARASRISLLRMNRSVAGSVIALESV
jgi:hypothetical protein